MRMPSTITTILVGLTYIILPEVSAGACQEGSLARYRVTFETFWSEQSFPNQYPLFRPPAQWSKLVGNDGNLATWFDQFFQLTLTQRAANVDVSRRVHNGDYELWSKGGVSSYAFQQLAEEAKTEHLDRETQGFNGLWETFYAPPILEGEGKAESDFTASANFSLVSIANRMIPSPDWFVGVDSVDMCGGADEDGWMRDHSIDLQPLDAGTDQGLTFTSPNWDSIPRQKIFQITAGFPAHRASSFFYPDLDNLPPIGRLVFKLLDIYQHKHTIAEVPHVREEINYKDGLAEEIAREKLEQAQILAGEPLPTRSNPGQAASRVRSQVLENGASRLPPRAAKTKKSFPNRRHKHRKNNELTQDCVVGVWSEWSACSKTCGFGMQTRTRQVLQRPFQGKACPLLSAEKWCGSMRNCETKYFSWLKADESNNVPEA